MSAEARLALLGITLGPPVAPVANYVPFVRTGALLFVSGQIPVLHGEIHWRGKLGDGVSVAEGQAAARQCMINLLGQVKAAVGSLDAVARVVRLGGFVAAAPGFFELAHVMNGASDLAGEVFG
jgi:enamine deaminase RidA (YjgF/YER057c/UK114 family)